jgi:hypothetical protein
LKRVSIHLAWSIIFLLSLTLTACTAQVVPSDATQSATPATPTASVAAATYTDPFSYCAAVGTIDKPDASYTGVAVPDEIINGFKKAASLQDSTEPMEMFKKTTIWRCMDKQVYVCNFGANLTCDSKADTNKDPTQAILDYCTANSDAEFVPMNVTGHSTIYSWRCVKTTPTLLDQVAQVDAAGYLAQIWYAVSSNP